MYANAMEISPDFTVEDIHKIRVRNYEKTKHMSVKEKLTYYNTPRTDAEDKAVESQMWSGDIENCKRD